MECWVIYEGLHHFVFDRFSECPENRSFCLHSYYDSGIQRRTPKPVLSESVDNEHSENSLPVQISPSDLELSRVVKWSKLPTPGEKLLDPRTYCSIRHPSNITEAIRKIL